MITAVTEIDYYQYVETNISTTLKSKGGNIGGGSESLAIKTNTFTMQAIGLYKESDKASALKLRDYKDATDLIERESDDMKAVVRRLTPLECERLQGFPDGWTDIGDWVDSKGKKHKGESDSPRYKALGNSIALPFWQWMAEKMVAQFDGPCTMGSLFDGIGGFPLVYEHCGCKAIWASEIEEFPIAVTKLHFPED